MNQINWTKFQTSPSPYVRWISAGQTVEGVLVDVREASFQGNDHHQIDLRTHDGSIVTVSATQARLKIALADQAPEYGDLVRIEYLGEADNVRPSQCPAKLFKVSVLPKATAR